MSFNCTTDERRDQVDCGSILCEKKEDSGVGSSLASLSLDANAVTEPDASRETSHGSTSRAAHTESDAVPCNLHLREEVPYCNRSETQLSENNASRCRKLVQPSSSSEAPTLSPSSKQKHRPVPVEQAEAWTQETVPSSVVPSRVAEQSLNQREPEQIQWRPERVKEEPEFFDIAMIYCSEDEELARKFGDVLQKFVTLGGEQKPRIYLDFLDLRDSLGGNETEHFNHVLGCSSYAFVFFSSKSVESKDLKGKWDRTIALHGSLTDENCAKVVPIVTEPNLRLGYSFGSFTKINLRSLLLGGRVLDRVAVDDLRVEHLDKRLLNRISSALNEARAKRRCKVTNCGVSNFELSTDAKQTLYHMERIQICYDVLVGSMDTEYGLITYLFSNKVLSLLEMESIAAENTRHGKNEKLLNLLYRKDAQSFEKFVCGLSESNQDHLAKRLREPIQR